jgi:hypothetical protein
MLSVLNGELKANGKACSGRSYEQVHGGPAIMRAWFRELPYIDNAGRPVPLPRQGSGASFTELVRTSAPEIEPNRALMDLLASGAVRMLDSQLVEPVSNVVIAVGQQSRAEMGLYAVDNLLTTVSMNVDANPSTFWFQREATCLRFDRRQLSRVRTYLSDECGANINEADEWLNHYSIPDIGADNAIATVVVGTYITVRELDTVDTQRDR